MQVINIKTCQKFFNLNTIHFWEQNEKCILISNRLRLSFLLVANKSKMGKPRNVSLNIQKMICFKMTSMNSKRMETWIIGSLSQVKSTIVKIVQHFYQKVSHNPIVPSKIIRQVSIFFYLLQQTIIDRIKIMITSEVFVTLVNKHGSKYWITFFTA